MSLDIKDIKTKAMQLLNKAEPYARRQTTGYDASKNMIIVAGLVLDGVVESTVSSNTLTLQEVGIDYYYEAISEVNTQRTLTVSVLPTANCLDLLRLLALKQLQNKGWFNISVHENDRIVNTYRGWIIELPEIGMQQEAEDRQIIFGIKTMFSGVSSIDQPSSIETETYSRYGVDPSKANNSSGDDSNIIIAENGKVFTIENNPDGDYGDDFDIDKLFPPLKGADDENITPIE